jgi:hypothetical protein
MTVWTVTEYDGGGIRGVFATEADAKAEIVAICTEHTDLTRADFCVSTYRVRPGGPTRGWWERRCEWYQRELGVLRAELETAKQARERGEL